MRCLLLSFILTVTLSVFGYETETDSVRKFDSEKLYWLSRYLSVSYPVKNMKVVSDYGYRKDPFNKGKKVFHSGIDIHAKYADVYAMFQGVVTAIGSDKVSGNYIKITSGSYTVSYCHLSRRYVSEGDTLYAGQPVAISGNTGRSTGAHLHITVRKNGEMVNPNILLHYIDKIRHDALVSLGISIKGLDFLSHDDFLKRYSPIAMQHQREYGIPASVTLSQMIHESCWGRSPLAVSGNNYFGIKCSTQWLLLGKPFTVHHDDKVGEKFCSYKDAFESMEHHARLLCSDRYKQCKKYSSTDYHNWLLALKKAGYASDPNYVARCEKIIKQHKLYIYDYMVHSS